MRRRVVGSVARELDAKRMRSGDGAVRRDRSVAERVDLLDERGERMVALEVVAPRMRARDAAGRSDDGGVDTSLGVGGGIGRKARARAVASRLVGDVDDALPAAVTAEVGEDRARIDRAEETKEEAKEKERSSRHAAFEGITWYPWG